MSKCHRDWHKTFQPFSPTLMSQLITFCDQTISNVNEEIEKTKAKLHAKLDRNKREQNTSTLEENDELNRKHLQQRKSKKCNYLKFNFDSVRAAVGRGHV